MSDTKKIVIGLAVLLLLITMPLWYSLIAGEAASPPGLVVLAEEEQCVEHSSYMRAEHMELLNAWRESVVRDGERTYIASDGQQYEISLMGTCLDCHSNKSEFCDVCHDYAGVEPNCWQCHITPEGD